MSLATTGATANPTTADGAAPGSREFQAAVLRGGFAVSGNTVDTGRYLITASNDYQRPDSYGGGTADDGAVRVFDKQSGTFVQVFGDPHVATGAGDRADFQLDGLVLDLADGTQLQFQPTEMDHGAAHIAAVSVTKDGETSFITGLYGTGAHVSISAAQAGNAFQLDRSFDAYSDTVLRAGDSLNDLRFVDGSQLDSKGAELHLDGKGGGIAEFLDERVPLHGFDLAMDARLTGEIGKTGVDAPEQAANTPFLIEDGT